MLLCTVVSSILNLLLPVCVIVYFGVLNLESPTSMCYSVLRCLESGISYLYVIVYCDVLNLLPVCVIVYCGVLNLEFSTCMCYCVLWCLESATCMRYCVLWCLES